MRVRGQRHAPAALSPEKRSIHCKNMVGGPQRRSGWEQNISLTPGVDPETAQPVDSHYTDCATLNNVASL